MVSVALSDAHQGGRLLFSMDGHVHCPPRPVGSAVAHNRAAVHGVSAITAGVRYNLIATFGDPEAITAGAARCAVRGWWDAKAVRCAPVCVRVRRRAVL